MDGICKVCGKQSEITDLDREIKKISCPLCGEYNMTRELFDDFEGFHYSQVIRAKISTLLRHRSIAQPNIITTLSEDVTRDEEGFSFITIDDFVNGFPKNLVDRADLALKNLAYLTGYAGEEIALDIAKDRNILITDSFAHASSAYMLDYLVTKGYVTSKNSTLTVYYVSILPPGWERLWEMTQKTNNTDNKNAFVAMWFDHSMDSVYENSIAKAIEECGYNAIRIDRTEHNNKIDDEIIANINSSKFVVCDFTGQRGGVYFEAGYAKGIGLPVIWTCRKDEIDNLHFDTRQFNHISWEDEKDFRVKLINRIRASII